MATTDAVRPIRLYGLLDEGPVRVQLSEEHTRFESLYEGERPGVYTAFRTFEHNQFLNLASHFTRLRASMARVGMSRELDVARVQTALHELCTAYPGANARVRIDVLLEPAVTLGMPVRDFIALAPYVEPDPQKWGKGVPLATTRALERSDPLTKTADFATQRQKTMDSLTGFEDGLMVSKSGAFLEGCSSNFYAIIGGALHTAGAGVLEGVTRGVVLQLARRLGIEVSMEAAHIESLPEMTEAAISSASRGVMPVTSIDGLAVGSGKVGPIVTRLQAAYTEFVQDNIRPATDI